MLNRQYYQACIAEGQTHQTLGTLYLHNHTTLSYQQAQKHYDEALTRFQSVAGHISNSYSADARQNLFVLKSTREEMKRFQSLMQEAEACQEVSEQYSLWLRCSEEILKFEQYDDETPFVHLRESAEKVYGKNSCEYAESLHLYAEFLYTIYSAEEDPIKLNEAKHFCEEAIGMLSSDSPN